MSGLETANFRTGNWDNSILRQAWGNTILPIWARQDSVDIFWGPAHRLPRFLPSNMSRVLTIHDLVWKHAGNTMRPISRLRERLQMPSAVKAADVIFAVSISTAQAAKAAFPRECKKLSVINLGVNLPADCPSRSFLCQFGIQTPYFLFIGTLEPRKNLDRLLLAFSKLSEQEKGSTKLVIAGGVGWGNLNIDKKVREFGLDSYVHLLGYVDEDTLNTLYKYAEFLVMPSLYEGFGLPLVEAMAHGVPVLTSNNSSMPEVAGEAGFLVDPLDVDSISHGLSEMINNKTLRAELASKAKPTAENFNWDKSAQQFITALEQLLKP